MDSHPGQRQDHAERFVIWKADGEPIRVICSMTVLESIRRECVRAARGPVPLGIGGALMGSASGGDYRIRHWHSIPCRYQRGPSFLLTKDEVGGLKDFLAHLPSLKSVGEDVLIGWFVSHPFLGAELRDDEISLHQRFFRSSDLFLLVEVHPDGAIEVGVHRGARAMQPVWRVVPSHAPREHRRIPETPSVIVPQSEPSGLTVTEEPRENPEPERRQPAPKKPLLLLLAALALVLFAFLWMNRDRTPPPMVLPPPPQPVPTLSLRVQRQQGALLIRWNPVEPTLALAQQVVLRITDGPSVIEHPLSEAMVRQGSFVHKSDAPALEVELRASLPDGRSVAEKVIYGR